MVQQRGVMREGRSHRDQRRVRVEQLAKHRQLAPLDRVGSRFETGVDRGVRVLAGGGPVP
jgi:hypothetical protein